MKKYIIPFFVTVLLVGISSCVKEKYAAPPVGNTDPNLVPNTTIAALSALPTATSGAQITGNLILEAVVVGDDRTGNLYKELDIEDSTGGIMLMIEGDDLYANYPVGRRLFIQLQGLYIVSYDGTNEIVASTDGGTFTGISTANISQYVVPGKWGIVTAPKLVTLSQITGNPAAYQSQLVQLNNVEFSFGSRGVLYANATYDISGSLTLQDCNLNTATVYTSGYASFASAVSPSGNGTMVCLAGDYNGAAQIIVRDTTDLHLTGTLCP
jgi:hypothetical protein